MAEAKYFPVTLHDRGDRQGSLGDPKPDMPSSEDPLLMRENTESTRVTLKLKAAFHFHLHMNRLW